MSIADDVVSMIYRRRRFENDVSKWNSVSREEAEKLSYFRSSRNDDDVNDDDDDDDDDDDSDVNDDDDVDNAKTEPADVVY